MNLSHDAILMFILRASGCSGRLEQGRIERGDGTGVQVYDSRGDQIDYISGDRLRSWCIIDAKGALLDEDWCSIQPEDSAFFPAKAREELS